MAERTKTRNEKKIEDEIKAYLDTLKYCWYFKVWGGGIYQEAGIPDIVACINGMFFGIEVKDPLGEPSTIQLATGWKIKRAKGHFIIVYSLAQVINYLKKIGVVKEE